MDRFFFFDARLCPTLEEIRYVLGEQEEETTPIRRFEEDHTGWNGEPLLMGTREREEERQKFVARPRTAEEIRYFVDGFETRTLWEMGIRYSLTDVAGFLNLSSTRLKELCRERGIPQWPRRFAMSLESVIEFPRTKETEKQVLRALLSESYHNRFVYESDAKVVFEKCKKRMYRIRHKLKNASALV